jgi:hypothetical protein
MNGSTVVQDPTTDSTGTYWKLMPPSPIIGPFSTTRDVVNNIPMFGMIVKQSFTATPTTQTTKTISFGTPVPHACLGVFMQCTNPNQYINGYGNYWTQLTGAPTTTGFTFLLQSSMGLGGSGDTYWIAIGY